MLLDRERCGCDELLASRKRQALALGLVGAWPSHAPGRVYSLPNAVWHDCWHACSSMRSSPSESASSAKRSRRV